MSRPEKRIVTLTDITEAREAISMKDFYAFKKEFQEFKAVSEEREKFKDRLWKERLAFLGLIFGSWGTTIVALLRLFKVI